MPRYASSRSNRAMLILLSRTRTSESNCIQQTRGEKMRRLALMIVLGMAVMPAVAQKPAFEVASIKRSASGQEGGGGGPRGDRFIVRNVPLRLLVNIAFRPATGQLFNQQIIGGPDWSRTDRFDVEAKMGGSFPSISYNQIQLMLQALLEDRFQLKAHREKRELPVYNLVVSKLGVKMRPSPDQIPPDPRQADIFFDSLSG